jgi:hypothetical protein
MKISIMMNNLHYDINDGMVWAEKVEFISVKPRSQNDMYGRVDCEHPVKVLETLLRNISINCIDIDLE